MAKKRTKRENIEEEYPESEMLFADGFDDAIIGVALASQGNANCSKIVYDHNKCIDILVERDKMSYDDAVEHLAYNVLDNYVGEHTPLFMEFA